MTPQTNPSVLNGPVIINGQRTRWLDTLRGLTMLLVVWQHVRYFTFGCPETTSKFAMFCITFRMPMFFFISGFIAYKAGEFWTRKNYLSRLGTKARVQLVPTVVFWLLYAGLFIHKNPLPFPERFWFTWALFMMFAIYFTVALLTSRSKLHLEDFILIAIAVVGVALQNKLPRELDIYLLGKHFIAFAAGLLARKYQEHFLRLISNRWFVLAAIVLPFAWHALVYGPNLQVKFLVRSMDYVRPVIALLILSVIFNWFRENAEFWNRSGWLQNTMEYIGRRTLDIYMLHYFFLPDLRTVNLKSWLWFNSATEFVIVGAVTVAVVAASLVASAYIRRSRLLGFLLFAAKR